MWTGCYTALVTPFLRDGAVDYEGLRTLVEFQCSQGVSGLLAVGTTGESATLSWEEHLRVIDHVAEFAGSKCKVIAGTGSNSTDECLTATAHAVDSGIGAVLLVDPYYNAPSSIEIRREYYEPVARRFPDIELIPYLIPGRTGTMLSPQDLAILVWTCPNVVGVKDAMGNEALSKQVRELCPEWFSIICGDDERTIAMMTDPHIRASATMSVMANIVPRGIESIAKAAAQGDHVDAASQAEKLRPLLGSVTVTTHEQTRFGAVENRARNPLPVKTIMSLLGMPAGPCRRPLGKMTMAALRRVVNVVRAVHETTDVLRPVEEFFGVDLDKRLYDERTWEGLCYANH